MKKVKHKRLSFIYRCSYIVGKSVFHIGSAHLCIPSGGFEAMNDCTDFDSQWDNYSLKKAIFRELLESALVRMKMIKRPQETTSLQIEFTTIRI